SAPKVAQYGDVKSITYALPRRSYSEVVCTFLVHARWSCCRGPLQSQQHHFGGELSIQVCLACPGGDVGVDRGGAAVIANGQRDLLRAFGPGQIGVMRNCVERVALGPGGLDPDLQAYAIDHPMELERSKPCPLKGAGRDGRRKGADLQGDQ